MIVIINGDSGAGKTYLLEELKKDTDNKFLPVRKYTTRTERVFENDKEPVDLVYNCDFEDVSKFKYHYDYKKEHYGIDEKELIECQENGFIPVVIIRDFSVIREIKEDFLDVMVLFIMGGTGENLAGKLEQQGRDSEEIKRILDKSDDIIKEYTDNIDIVNHCIVNFLYDRKIYLDQFYYYTLNQKGVSV